MNKLVLKPKPKFTIIKGKDIRKARVFLYGVEGVGKSTLASLFPNPVFIDTEDRIRHIDATKIRVNDWHELTTLLTEIDEFITENELQVDTIIIDSVDWAQKMAMENVCRTRNVDSIEDFGYGKGYVYIYELMLDLIKLLTNLNQKYHICLTAHSVLRKFEDPYGITYDRYTLKLLSGDRTAVADSFKEWCDYLFFMNYVIEFINNTRVEKRCIFTNRTAKYDAKRSKPLPDAVEFDINTIQEFIKEICS